MNKSKFFKIFALVNFVGLVVIFLLYRNGTFDSAASTTAPVKERVELKEKEIQPKQHTEAKPEVKETIPEEKKKTKKTEPYPEDDGVKPIDQMMYSSKSIIVAEPLKVYPEVKSEEAPTIMPSSKSGVIFKPKVSPEIKKKP